MKAMRVVFLVTLLLTILTGATCIDKATGTKQNPDGTVTQDPNNPVSIFGSVVGYAPLPFAGLIGMAITGLPGIWAAVRGRQWKSAAVATATATGKIIRTLPDSSAKSAALKTIDLAHDACGIVESLQGHLQDTAAEHASAAA